MLEELTTVKKEARSPCEGSNMTPLFNLETIIPQRYAYIIQG
jgi:hypothetical protein